MRASRVCHTSALLVYDIKFVWNFLFLFSFFSCFFFLLCIRLVLSTVGRPSGSSNRALQNQIYKQQEALMALQQRHQTFQCRLYVGSLHFEITEEDMRSVFQPFGKLRSVIMAVVCFLIFLYFFLGHLIVFLLLYAYFIPVSSSFSFLVCAHLF